MLLRQIDFWFVVVEPFRFFQFVVRISVERDLETHEFSILCICIGSEWSLVSKKVLLDLRWCKW